MFTHSFDKSHQVGFTILFRLAIFLEESLLPNTRNKPASNTDLTFRCCRAVNFHRKYLSTSANPPKLDHVGAGRPMKWMIGLHVGQNRDMFRL